MITHQNIQGTVSKQHRRSGHQSSDEETQLIEDVNDGACSCMWQTITPQGLFISERSKAELLLLFSVARY